MLSASSVYDMAPCESNDFNEVERYIGLLELDSNDLQPSQFVVAKKENKVIGFGRLRTYAACQELCSLGVIEPFRNKGAGTTISLELIKRATLPLYVVTIIPGFFTRIGFEETENFPEEISAKIRYCTGSLPVPETYVAMRLK